MESDYPASYPRVPEQADYQCPPHSCRKWVLKTSVLLVTGVSRQSSGIETLKPIHDTRFEILMLPFSTSSIINEDDGSTMLYSTTVTFL